MLFDLGGVFLDWDPRYLYAKIFKGDTEAMEDFLANVCTPEWHAQMDAGRPIAQCCRELAAQFPGKADLIFAWGERADEMIRGVFQGTVELFAELRAAGVPCYALSNMERENYDRRLGLYPFMNWFDGSFISGHEGVMKPDPEYFHRALARLGLAPDDGVFTDDRPANIRAAESVGIRSVLFTGAAHLRRQLVGLGLLAGGAARCP